MNMKKCIGLLLGTFMLATPLCSAMARHTITWYRKNIPGMIAQTLQLSQQGLVGAAENLYNRIEDVIEEYEARPEAQTGKHRSIIAGLRRDLSNIGMGHMGRRLGAAGLREERLREEIDMLRGGFEFLGDFFSSLPPEVQREAQRAVREFMERQRRRPNDPRIIPVDENDDDSTIILLRRLAAEADEGGAGTLARFANRIADSLGQGNRLSAQEFGNLQWIFAINHLNRRGLQAAFEGLSADEENLLNMMYRDYSSRQRAQRARAITAAVDDFTDAEAGTPSAFTGPAVNKERLAELRRIAAGQSTPETRAAERLRAQEEEKGNLARRITEAEERLAALHARPVAVTRNIDLAKDEAYTLTVRLERIGLAEEALAKAEAAAEPEAEGSESDISEGEEEEGEEEEGEEEEGEPFVPRTFGHQEAPVVGEEEETADIEQRELADIERRELEARLEVIRARRNNILSLEKATPTDQKEYRQLTSELNNINSILRQMN